MCDFMEYDMYISVFYEDIYAGFDMDTSLFNAEIYLVYNMYISVLYAEYTGFDTYILFSTQKYTGLNILLYFFGFNAVANS